MKKKLTIMFVLLSAFVWQMNAQTLPPINGVSCTPGTPSPYLYTEDFEYSDTDDAIGNGGWTGKLDQNNNNPLWPKNGQWGICADSELRTGNTGPSSSYSGSKYLMFEANGSSNKAEVVSPAIDLTFTSEDLELSFYMHAWGADIGTLEVGIGLSPTGPFTNVFTQTGAYQNAWAPVGVDLSAYLGQVIYLSFDYTAGAANFGDIAIDFIRLQTCGEFCVPGNLNVSNITDTQATMAWTPSSAQTQWEYVLQLDGGAVPTGNGTLAPTSTIAVSNLLDGYTYEVYYRSVCTTGFSDWAGPKIFTTELSYNKTIDCSADQYILNYCYKSVAWNGSPIEFTYTSSNGNPIMLFINEGVLGLSSFGSNDDLVVEDADGNVLYRGTGNNGNISGLSFRSDEISLTSNVLRFYIDADTFGDCGKDKLTPINATVSCLSCTDIPEASYSTEFSSDCATNPEYYLNVDVKSLGDASSLIISDNLGLYSESVAAIGTTQIGPFNFNLNVQITVADASSSSCFTRSKLFKINTCPPANDECENATELAIGEYGSCNNGTEGTLLQATPSSVNIPDISCSSTSGNDVWYKFVATHTAQRIIFRDFFSNEYLDHSFYKGDDCNNLTELYCYQNFDDFAANPTILTPQLTIGDTYYVRVYTQDQGSPEYEFSICIQDPPPGGEEALCNNAEPLCLDETGTYKTTATTGIINYLWSESWGNRCLEWTANPTWMTFEVQESGPLSFTISQTGGNSSNDVDVAIFGPFDTIDGICNDYLTMEPVACAAGNSGIEKLNINVLAGEKYLILSANVSLYPHDLFVVQSNFGEAGAAVLRNRFKEPTVINPEPICDDLGGGVETFDLTVYDAEILDGDTSFMVSYYLSRGEAQEDINAINSIEVAAGVSQTIYARMHTGPNSYCYTLTFFQLVVLENPEANSINPDLICDELSDGFEMVDLSNFSNEISGNAEDVNVQYYLSESQAILGSSPLYPVLKIEVGSTVEVFARVTDENYCFSISSFVLSVDQPYAEFNTSEIDYSVCNSEDLSIEISLINNNFDQFNDGVTITWYRNEEELIGENGLSLNVSTSGNYRAHFIANNSNCDASAIATVNEKSCFGNAKFAQGISANNDGINDVFDLKDAGVGRIEIFDRNGMLVFSKDNYVNEWHGQNKNGDQLPVGVYFYSALLKNGETKNGYVYLNR